MHDPLSAYDWDELRYFLAAAREGGFGAGARALGAQQSTVSRRVASLEARLGAPLFDRRAAGLELTSLGRLVRDQAERMERALLDITAQAAGAHAAVEGLVRLATTETMAATFLLPRVVPRLFERYPALRLDLIIGDAPADLGRREAEIAVRFFLMPSGDVVTRRVARLPTAIVAHRALAEALSTRPPSSWPWTSVWLTSGSPAEHTWLERELGVEPRLTTNSFHAQYEAVRAGLGVAILPELLTAASPDLCTMTAPVAPTPPIDVYLAAPRGLRGVPRIAAVWEMLVEAFAELGAADEPRE